MRRFSKALYPTVRDETFFESCGVADLVATCYGGRNRLVALEFTRAHLVGSWEGGAVVGACWRRGGGVVAGGVPADSCCTPLQAGAAKSFDALETELLRGQKLQVGRPLLWARRRGGIGMQSGR